MTMQEQMDADVLATENDGGEPFLFEGKEFIGQRTTIVDGTAMVENGFELMLDFKLTVR